MMIYANNGILNIDNNPVEISIRPVAVGYVKLYIMSAERITYSRAHMKQLKEAACCIVCWALAKCTASNRLPG
jgi:hypothetical protein